MSDEKHEGCDFCNSCDDGSLCKPDEPKEIELGKARGLACTIAYRMKRDRQQRQPFPYHSLADPAAETIVSLCDYIEKIVEELNHAREELCAGEPIVLYPETP